MKKKYKIIIGIAVLAVSAAAGMFYLLQSKSVGVQAVSYGVLSEKVTEQGQLAPNRSITINADTTGVMGKIQLEAGRMVSAEDIIFEIDNSVLKNELENQIASLKFQQNSIYASSSMTQAEIALQKEQLERQLAAAVQESDLLFDDEKGTADSLRSLAQSSFSLAKRAYTDARDAYEDAHTDYYVSQSELYTLHDQMNSAQKNLIIAKNNSSNTTRAYYKSIVDSCKLQLEIMGKNDAFARNSANAAAAQLQITIDELTEKINHGHIKAPGNGIVWQILVDEGDFVMENQPIAKIYMSDEMIIEVPLLSQDALALSVGDVASCKFADGTIFDAAVTLISPVAENVISSIGLAENRCMVKLSPKGMPENAGAGHQVDTTFSFVAAENALSVFASSIVPYDETMSAVYVVRDGKAVLVPVETGARGGGQVEVLSGLAEGDQVILNPYDNDIKNGDRVSVK